MTFKEIASLCSLTLKVNKLQNRFIKLIENKIYYKKIFLFILKNKKFKKKSFYLYILLIEKFHVIALCKEILQTRHLNCNEAKLSEMERSHLLLVYKQ